MNPIISRREAIISLASVAVALAASARAANVAANAPHVKPGDPIAQALAYFEDAKSVDARKFPSYKPGQNCANCLQLTGKEGEVWRPCNLFPGKLVHANGWCKVYVRKP